MIRKVKQRASRVGLQKCQFLFSINITQLIVSNDSQIPPNAVLNICFEKGGKISASNEIVFDMNRNDVNPLNKPGNLKNATIPIDERVELVVTMYKESASGVLQAKRGKLILRQLKRNPGLGMDAFKVIGVHMIDLHSLAQEIGKDRSLSKESILAMEPSIGCSLNAIITTKAIIKRPSLLFGMRNGIVRKSFTHTGKVGEDSDADETNSVGSIVSDSSVFSTLGATFYYEDLEDYSGKGDGIVSSQGSATSDLHFGSPERVYQNRSGKQRNSTSQQLQDNYDYNEYSSEGGESSSSSMGGVKGSRRRRSGLHVMEVAMHGSERRPIKPLSRRPSAVHSALTAESSSSKVNTTSTGVLGSTLVDISTKEDVSTLTVASIGLMPPVPLADDSGDGFTDSRDDGELTYTYQQPDQQHLYDQQLESQPPPLSPSPSSVRPPLSPLDVAKDAPSSLLGTSSVAARDATRAKDGSAREVVEDSAVWATGVMDEEGWQALPSSARSKSSRTSNNSNSVSPYFANRSPYGSPYHSVRKKGSHSAHNSPAHHQHLYQQSHQSPQLSRPHMAAADLPLRSCSSDGAATDGGGGMGVAGASPSQLQPQLQPQHAYDHSETFVLYARELQARDERIAALETALARAEEGHRAEVLALRGELHSTQAELRLQVQVSAALSTSTCPAAPLSVFVDEGPINVLVCSRCRETGIVAAKHSDLPTMDSEIPVGVTGFEREGLTVESSSEATKSVEMEADAAIGSTVEQQRSSPPNVRVSRYSYNHRTQDDDNNINTRAAQPIPSSHVRSTSTSASTAATPDDKQEAALRGGDLIDDVNDTTSTAATSGNNKRRGVDGCTATPGQVAALFSVPLSIPDENENGASSVVVASDFGSNENTATPAASNTALPASNVTGGGVGGGTLALSSSSGVGPYTAGSAAAAAVSALLSDYGRTSAQVQMLAQDLLYYKKLAEEALQAKAEETMAAREAATVAVQACMRRADCEQQLGDAKEHLLDLQRRYARLSLQCESEQRHNYGLKARLQVYAQKLSALEVDYSHSLHHLEDLESAAAGSVEN